MNPNTITKAKILKIKRTKGTDPPPAREKHSRLNTALPFVKTAKNTNSDKEIVSIKMRIDDTVSKYYKTNYKTNSFKLIKTFGYNVTSMVETLCALNLDIFILYYLKGLILAEKRLGLFLRVFKITAKAQFQKYIQDCQNQVLDE